MRTLSARILLGFAALTIAFGVITATVVVNIGQIEDHVLLISQGYVPLALESKDLKSRQSDLSNYLDTGDRDARDKTQAAKISSNVLKRYRNARDGALRETASVFSKLDAAIDIDPRRFFVQSRPQLNEIERRVRSLEPLYDKVMETRDPSEQERAFDVASHLVQWLAGYEPFELWVELATSPLVDPIRRDTLARLRSEEATITKSTQHLSEGLERMVSRMTDTLENNEHILRVRTIYFGLGAGAIGLLIATWVVITLRPLRRLRDGARRVAAGDYASRIPEHGPSEVAELAREFNSMGRAVEERERERVRSERLAAVGKMAAMITHEVRNPLSSIGLNAELLDDELGDNEEARVLCTAIHREVDRLTAITEEYLAFARLPKPKLAAEAVNTMVGALAAFVREDLAAKGVALAVELAAGDPIATIDGGQIRQCLLNLVRNASDAIVANGGGTVTLRTRVRLRRIEIEVEDDGIGIPPDVQPRLFDPFFSTKEGGSGLGLALTQQIVRDHGGDVHVRSTVGRGTTFTVSVPAGS